MCSLKQNTGTSKRNRPHWTIHIVVTGANQQLRPHQQSILAICFARFLWSIRYKFAVFSVLRFWDELDRFDEENVDSETI
ncbi:unnamed protein product [Caenorhabditis angaria]|uniref:Uncharacterized protein n=1 Tax=Caenorhabditis angaria TaxID=860376 RepID=A0A9P1N1I4_9PELO|nr:unnamed protein product [Caenorhabditis angaria]